MIRPQEKPRRERDSAYMKWIKTLPCLVCYVLQVDPKDVSDPHHVIPDGGGKMGSKVSDRRCIPMCRFHHEFSPRPDQLQSRYHIDVETWIRHYNAKYAFALKQEKLSLKKERQASHRLQVLCANCRKVHRVKKASQGYVFFCRGRNVEI